MIPPMWEFWVCMLNAMNLINMHPIRIEAYLPSEDDVGLIGLESMQSVRAPMALPANAGEYQEAS